MARKKKGEEEEESGSREEPVAPAGFGGNLDACRAHSASLAAIGVCLLPPPPLLCLSHFCHLPAEITSTGRAGGRMRVGASGYNSRYIAYEIRCLQGWRSHERL